MSPHQPSKQCTTKHRREWEEGKTILPLFGLCGRVTGHAAISTQVEGGQHAVATSHAWVPNLRTNNYRCALLLIIVNTTTSILPLPPFVSIDFPLPVWGNFGIFTVSVSHKHNIITMAEDRIISPTEREEEQQFDASLRPKTLQDYIGQEAIKANLKIFIEAAKQREESLEHVLLHGAPGLGKTTLAHIIAREMGVNIRITSGTAIERAGDLAAILTNLQPGDILFIDEIHRLHRTIEEVLYPAMEDYALDLVVGKGPGAKTLRLDLPKFTIIGATTRMSLLSSPLRDRFGNSFRLDFYQPQDLQKILTRSARILNVTLDSPSSQRISQCARQTPRIANRLLKRVRDYAQVHGDGIIALPLAEKALSMLEIDHMGLDTLDRRILEIIIDKFQGGPVGLHTIAATTGEEIDTIADVYEPFLLQLGLLARTLRGRIATEQAYKHLKRSLPTQTQKAAI